MRASFKEGIDAAPEEAIKRWTKVYVCRDVDDEDVMLSFGCFDGTLEELRGIQAGSGRDEQIERLAPMIAEVLLDGSFEVVEEITP